MALERMINSRKLPLILDLDDTILHKEKTGQRKIKLRPGAKDLLGKAVETFDIYVNTAATPSHLADCRVVLRKEKCEQYISDFVTSSWACSNPDKESNVGYPGKDFRQSLAFCCWQPYWHLVHVLDDSPEMWGIAEQRIGVLKVKKFEGRSVLGTQLKQKHYLLHNYHGMFFLQLDRELARQGKSHKEWRVGVCELPRMDQVRNTFNQDEIDRRMEEREESRAKKARRA